MGRQSEAHIGVAVALIAAAMVPLAALLGFVVLFVTVLTPTSQAACTSSGTPTVSMPAGSGGGGEWLATAYGPPWDAMQGSGVTATGIDLRPAKHAYIIAVDPHVIPLGSYVHVSPNPFGNDKITFLAADTGGAIIGKHIDIYDWRGRADQNTWGARHVTVTPAAKTGTAQILETIPQTGEQEAVAECSAAGSIEGPLPLTSGQRARVLPDGLAAAPSEAPRQVKEMIAAGNRLDHATYIWGGGHAQTLDTLQPGYDCSGSVSYVLHAGHVFGSSAEVAAELESYGEPGPGKWVTVYANSEHTFMYVAGIRFDTSHKGTDEGPNRDQDGPRWRIYPEVPKWAQWAVRHPPGL